MTVFESPQPRRFAVRTIKGMTSCRIRIGAKSGGVMVSQNVKGSAGTARPTSIHTYQFNGGDVSPSSITQDRIHAIASTLNEVKRTEPSPNTAFSPPGWAEPK